MPRFVVGAVAFVLVLMIAGVVLRNTVQDHRIPCLTLRERAQLGLVQIREALDTYAASNDGQYPETLEEILPLLDRRSVPYDPWKSEYWYVLGETGVYVLQSFGRGGTPGGTGEEADLEVHPEIPEPHEVLRCPSPPAMWNNALWNKR